MATENLRCWSCGGALTAVPLPFGRSAECPQCEIFIRCCRQCQFYAPGASKDCGEPNVEEVLDKEQGNFCDYFRPKAGLAASGDPAAAAARAKLANVFGGGGLPGGKPEPGAKPVADPKEDSEAEASRRKLEALFGKPKK